MREPRRVGGLVLAGGLGRRMGGVDKGLQEIHGRPLIAWALDRLKPQVANIVVSANQNLDDYRALGYPVVSDLTGDYSGPLAGFQAGLKGLHETLIATVPCDSPFLPVDLVARLRAGLEREGADIAVAKTGTQPHPVFCLFERAVASHLSAYLARGGRKIDAWYATLQVAQVSFDDVPEAFANINTLDELQQFEASNALTRKSP